MQVLDEQGITVPAVDANEIPVEHGSRSTVSQRGHLRITASRTSGCRGVDASGSFLFKSTHRSSSCFLPSAYAGSTTLDSSGNLHAHTAGSAAHSASSTLNLRNLGDAVACSQQNLVPANARITDTAPSASSGKPPIARTSVSAAAHDHETIPHAYVKDSVLANQKQPFVHSCMHKAVSPNQSRKASRHVVLACDAPDDDSPKTEKKSKSEANFRHRAVTGASDVYSISSAEASRVHSQTAHDQTPLMLMNLLPEANSEASTLLHGLTGRIPRATKDAAKDAAAKDPAPLSGVQETSVSHHFCTCT